MPGAQNSCARRSRRLRRASREDARHAALRLPVTTVISRRRSCIRAAMVRPRPRRQRPARGPRSPAPVARRWRGATALLGALADDARRGVRSSPSPTRALQLAYTPGREGFQSTSRAPPGATARVEPLGGRLCHSRQRIRIEGVLRQLASVCRAPVMPETRSPVRRAGFIRAPCCASKPSPVAQLHPRARQPSGHAGKCLRRHRRRCARTPQDLRPLARAIRPVSSAAQGWTVPAPAHASRPVAREIVAGPG